MKAMMWRGRRKVTMIFGEIVSNVEETGVNCSGE